MSAPRWNVNEIIQFLELYETYELLWNIRHQDYTNKNKRELSFEKLVLELSEQGFENIDREISTSKIENHKNCVQTRTVKNYEIEKEWCWY
jgi:hypothetical protein